MTMEDDFNSEEPRDFEKSKPSGGLTTTAPSAPPCPSLDTYSEECEITISKEITASKKD